ncbi:MAG: NADH-quinone oxidoreductase subunit NuoF [Candidatus Aminicenantes bacterium]|nr:NADH-quinone oxidoreductase subunit NuoF [Candidatus Aminicenantes bacterium]
MLRDRSGHGRRRRDPCPDLAPDGPRSGREYPHGGEKILNRLLHPGHLEDWRKRLIDETSPVRRTIVVTAGTCGRASGALEIRDALQAEIDRLGAGDNVGLLVTGCHGFCEMEPSVIVQPEGIFYGKLKPEDAPAIVKQTALAGKVVERLALEIPGTERRAAKLEQIPFYRKQMRLVSENNFRVDPERIEDYIRLGGYHGLLRGLYDMTADGVIEEIRASGLRGRGGAGFPTALKWDLCRRSSGHPKYVVCNADEGDPGAYMDRSLLEGNPHAVIEGLIIGAYAIGASEGFVYVRGEYPLAVRNVERAIGQARECGLLGKAILGSEFSFDLHVVEGAGAFVSGEETAMMASIEGRKAFPRPRPPYPAEAGLWGKPTNINNVETWATVPIILDRGSAWFASIGTEKSKGTKIFSLVGQVRNTGLVEVPMGVTLREIVEEIGGGVPEGRKLKAVQTGGPSGGCIPAASADLVIDYETLAKAGSIMGSGGMIVLDDRTCMVDLARYYLHFLEEESCGKCAPCRVGTRQMSELLRKMTAGKADESDLRRLEQLAQTVKTASLCGLGQTAANPVLSTLAHFRSEYEAHIREKRCPARVCREIISSPCQYACPIGQEASTYIALVAAGRIKEAYEVIVKDNPLPSICGRACDHPCEIACKAGESGEPISIRAIKRYVCDRAAAEGWDQEVRGDKDRVPRDRENVAIIGGGPAGLTAAYDLAEKGFRPTVFEALPVAGGMLAAGIPNHRLPKTIIAAEVEAIRKAGVEIRTGVRVGRDVTIEGLKTDGFKAFFLATGAWKSMRLNVPGEESKGVLQSLPYLKAVNLGEPVNIGPRVIVVGGGNSAIDAARAAVRDPNVKSVTILYRRTRAEMPAFPEEVEAAIDEGIDLKLLAAPVKILAKNGKVAGALCLKMKLGDKDAGGRRKPVPVEGSDYKVEAETVILAVGERSDTSCLTEKDGVAVSASGSVIADPETKATSVPGVFAGGDVVTGPASVIEAMAAGRRAAAMIECYLEGRPLLPEYKLTRPSLYIEAVALTPEEAVSAARPPMPHLAPAKRAKNFKEVELGLKEKAALGEARRCLRCDLETEDGRRAIKALKLKSGGRP